MDIQGYIPELKNTSIGYISILKDLKDPDQVPDQVPNSDLIPDLKDQEMAVMMTMMRIVMTIYQEVLMENDNLNL